MLYELKLIIINIIIIDCENIYFRFFGFSKSYLREILYYIFKPMLYNIQILWNFEYKIILKLQTNIIESRLTPKCFIFLKCCKYNVCGSWIRSRFFAKTKFYYQYLQKKLKNFNTNIIKLNILGKYF